MFINPNTHIRILSVLPYSWKATNTKINGRPFFALSLRLLGDAVIHEGDREVALTTGDILYMPAEVDYHLHSGEEKILAIHFEALGDVGRRMEHYRPHDISVFRRDFMLLAEIWKQKEPGSYLRAMSLFYQLLSRLSDGSVRNESADYERIRPAMEHLHTHYTDPELTVRQLCDLAFVSDTYFRRLFLSVYGETPRRYLNRLRVEHAGALLREQNCSVTQTAQLSGFSDAKHFSTVFRHYMGVSPSQYRDGARAQNS